MTPLEGCTVNSGPVSRLMNASKGVRPPLGWGLGMATLREAVEWTRASIFITPSMSPSSADSWSSKRHLPPELLLMTKSTLVWNTRSGSNSTSNTRGVSAFEMTLSRAVMVSAFFSMARSATSLPRISCVKGSFTTSSLRPASRISSVSLRTVRAAVVNTNTGVLVPVVASTNPSIGKRQASAAAASSLSLSSLLLSFSTSSTRVAACTRITSGQKLKCTCKVAKGSTCTPFVFLALSTNTPSSSSVSTRTVSMTAVGKGLVKGTAQEAVTRSAEDTGVGGIWVGGMPCPHTRKTYSPTDSSRTVTDPVSTLCRDEGMYSQQISPRSKGPSTSAAGLRVKLRVLLLFASITTSWFVGLSIGIMVVTRVPTSHRISGKSTGGAGLPLRLSLNQNSPRVSLQKWMLPSDWPDTNGLKIRSYLAVSWGPTISVSSPITPSPTTST
mmetsp:Transcript_20868/g.34920  ORF Transcript_20868/g.34920 Transcript_20868/m.34920 type:complete len:442 (-) Transcript_20868:6477-7802(-)